MTTDRPTATEVDFFTWNRDFHGIRPRGTDDMRPGKISTGVARVALAIAAHVNGKTGKAAIGTRRLAQAAQVSTGTIANALPILESLGWVQVERSKKANMNSDAVNVYRLTSPVAALRAVDNCPEGASGDETGVPQEMRQGASGDETGVPQEMRQGASGDENELRLLTSTSTTREEIHSVRASADHADASANGGETELPDTWSPGKFHRSAAEKLHMDVETLADDFRATMVGEKRGDWDSTFGAYIKERSTDRADVTFPDPGTDEDPFAPTSTSPDPAQIARDIDRIARTGDLAAKPLTEDEHEAAAWHLEQGHPWQEVAGYLEARRENRPIVLGELGPSETDPWTGVYNSDWCRENARQYIVRDLRDRAIDPDSLTEYELDNVTAMLNNDEGPERAADWVKRNRSPIPA